MTTALGRWLVPASVVAGAALVVGGCSTSDPTPPLATLGTGTGLPSTSGSGTGSATTTRSTTPTATATATGAVSPLSAKPGYRPANLSADQLTVVKAYDAYWVFRAQSLGTNTVDLSNGGTVASAQGFSQISTYASQQKARGQHAAGEITTNLTAVALAGSTATLTDCSLDNSYDVKTDTGVQLAKPKGLIKVTIVLVRQPSGWVVANINPSTSTCTVPTA